MPEKIEYRPVYDAELLIVHPPGCAGNFICEVINEYTEQPVVGPLHGDNEFRSIPNHVVASCHLHEFFKLQADDGKQKVYSHTRYKEVLQQLKNKQVLVILPEHHAGLVDCFALYKMYQREGQQRTLDYVKSRAALDFALEHGHRKQNKHYDIFVKYLQKYNVEHLVVTYQNFVLDNNVEQFNQFIGEDDLGLDFTDYNNSNYYLIRKMKYE